MAQPDKAVFQYFPQREDLGEMNNLAAQKPELVQEFDALIEAFLTDTKAVVPIPNPAFDPAPIDPISRAIRTRKLRVPETRMRQPDVSPAPGKARRLQS